MIGRQAILSSLNERAGRVFEEIKLGVLQMRRVRRNKKGKEVKVRVRKYKINENKNKGRKKIFVKFGCQ